MGISKYHVRASHIIYTQLWLIVTFWNICCWTLSKVTTVFGVTLDTPTYIWFSEVILLQGFKIILYVTYYGHDINVWPKQPYLLLNLLMGDAIVLSPPILQSLTTSKLTDFSVFQKNTWKTYKTTYYTSKFLVICLKRIYGNNLGELKQ